MKYTFKNIKVPMYNIARQGLTKKDVKRLKAVVDYREEPMGFFVAKLIKRELLKHDFLFRRLGI